MASGNPVVEVVRVLPPAASNATFSTRAGGSTPAEAVEIIVFPASADAYMDFECTLRGYGSGGLTFTLPWTAASATTGTVRWKMAVRRMADDAEDIDTAQTYDFNSVDDSPADVSGELSYPQLTFTNGSDMDNWTDNETAIVRLYRDTTVGGNMTGNAELWNLIGKET